MVVTVTTIDEAHDAEDRKVIRFVVYGHPEPSGSKKGFYNERMKRTIITDANRNSRPWKNAVSATAAIVFSDQLLDGPLAVTMTFYQARPKGHYGTGRNSRNLKPSSPPFPIGAPDVLKLARGAEDALTGVIWTNDARIVDEHLSKRYGTPERVEITITEIT